MRPTPALRRRRDDALIAAVLAALALWLALGGAVWRAVLLQEEYQQVYGTFPDQMSMVLVIRHFGIAMGMAHAFWEKEGVGEQTKTKTGA